MPTLQSRLLAAFLPLLFCVSAAGAQQPVFVEPLIQVPTQETERVIGSLRARATSIIAAREEGVLLELGVREADRVKAGDVLARQDTRRLQASRLQMVADKAMAKATLLERVADLEDAELDLEALLSASKSGAVSERELRAARTRVSVGKALREAATQSIASYDAGIALTDIHIADAVVRAPFDAYVTARHSEVGQWTKPGDSLVTLVSTGALEAWLELPERLIGRYDLGAEQVALRAEASGANMSGALPRSIPMVNERSRTFYLVLDVTAQAVATHSLQPGMSISGTVPLGKQEPQLLVSKNGVLRRGTSSLVVIVGEDGLAQHVPVRVLFAKGEQFAIEPVDADALRAGQLIVVEGNERLFPGTPVEAVRRDQAAQQG